MLSYTLGGLLFQKQPVPFVTSTIFSYYTQRQAIILLQNFKLAHYMKISPRVLFIVQLISSIILSAIAYIDKRYLISNQADFCVSNDWLCNAQGDPLQENIFPGSKSFEFHMCTYVL